jgi:hypothetical protein
MWMLGDSSLVVVLVWDAVAAVPVPREAGEADESGRGLAIVASLSAQWGYYHPPGRLGGKVTWALIDGALHDLPVTPSAPGRRRDREGGSLSPGHVA